MVENLNEIYKVMVDARRQLHMYPELSENENETQKYIISILSNYGIKYSKIAKTGVLAIVQGELEGKTVAYRADIDALPIHEISEKEYISQNKGVMHACGHDAHCAIALGTAIYFQQNRDKLKGNVKFFFQPAEETVGGAKRMVEEGCMKNPDVEAVLGLHVIPDLKAGEVEIKYGTLNASTDTAVLTVKGKAGHGAYPHKSVDAILIAAQIVVSAQSIVSRYLPPTESGVISFGTINGGVKANVIADEVVLVATIRSQNTNVRNILFEKLETMSKGIASSFGGNCEMYIAEDGYPPLVNDNSVVDIIADSAKKIVGDKNLYVKNEQSMGGEDFAYFIENVKGGFYHVGCKIKEKGDYSLHTVDFDIDERCMETALNMNIEILNRLLEG